MLDWSKLLKVKIESKEDVPRAMSMLCETMPNNMLLNMIKKSKERGHEDVLKYLEEEKIKRGVK